MSLLAGRVAIVTGASRGIGAAVATALDAAGARVALVARDARALEALAATLGGGPAVVPCDLTDPDAPARVLEATRAAFGDPDLLVNNAGAFHVGEVGALPVTHFDEMLAVNLAAPYRVLDAIVPGMRARGRGHVVTIGSVADHAIFPENAGYAATKFGMRALHEVLRTELRGTGVRATLVSPGPVDTAIWDALPPDTRPRYPAAADMLRPADVADAVLWAVTRPAEVNVDVVRLGRA